MSCCDGDESLGCHCGTKAFERFLRDLPKNLPEESPYWDSIKINMLQTCFHALQCVDSNKVRKFQQDKVFQNYDVFCSLSRHYLFQSDQTLLSLLLFEFPFFRTKKFFF